MKKITITLMSLFVIFVITNGAFADPAQTGGAGTTVTCADTNGGSGDSVTFNPSPGTLMGGDISSTAFTIGSVNLKATSDAIGYSVVSSDNKIYQKAMDVTSSTSSVATMVAGTSISGWTAKE